MSASPLLRPLEELIEKLREMAIEIVPPEYADRDLHYKYLKLDNRAAGLDEAADALERVLRESGLAELLEAGQAMRDWWDSDGDHNSSEYRARWDAALAKVKGK